MPDDSDEIDAEIIRAAYADKVKEAFKVFAENLGMGQNQKSSADRFVRSLELMRKARDMALAAMSGMAVADQAAQNQERPGADAAQPNPDGLTAEHQAMIDQALAGTTGQKAPLRR